MTSTPTLQAVSTTPTLTPAGTQPVGGGADSAEFVADVTIPDGTVMSPGQTFSKTWRLRNNGTTTWTTAYAVIFKLGTQMGAPSATPLTAEVKPGDTIDISLNLTAPSANGYFTASFMLRNTGGQLFGVGKGSAELFYTTIVVSSGVGTPAITATPGGTPGITSTPGTITPVAGGPTITAITLSVDKTSYSGTCPIRLNFNTTITAQGAGSITYQFDAGTDNPKFTFTLPGPSTAALKNSGTNSLTTTYYLNIETSVNGWAQMAVTGGNTLRSSQINFSVTCQ